MRNKLNYVKLSTDEFSSHQIVISYVSQGAKVLDVGCATGYLAKELLKKNCRIWGVDISKQSGLLASEYCENIIIGDIETEIVRKKIAKLKYDYIILADVLEHLKNPEICLKSMTYMLNKSGRIIISVPNIGFLTYRLKLLKGDFEYEETGIMDKTHLKLFTKKSLINLLYNSGLKIVAFDPVGNFTQLPLFMQTLYKITRNSSWWKNIEKHLTKLWPEGLAVQFVVVCKNR